MDYTLEEIKKYIYTIYPSMEQQVSIYDDICDLPDDLEDDSITIIYNNGSLSSESIANLNVYIANTLSDVRDIVDFFSKQNLNIKR